MYENYVSNTENDQIVEKIFTILGYSMLTLVVYGSLVWAYYASDKNQNLFISVFSLYMLLYAIVIVSIVVINKNNYDALSYTLLFGITIFVIFTSFFICVFFILKYFNIFSSTIKNNVNTFNNVNAVNAINANNANNSMEYRTYR
jgi:hypothetical protein